MQEKTRIALLRILYSLSFFTLGMVANTIFDYYGFDEVAYHIFAITLSLTLFLIVLSLTSIVKPITSMYRAYLMFLCLSFTNLCNAIPSSATKIDAPKIWFAAGFVFYSIILINEALIKERK